MREITSHKVNGLNDALRIDVIDPPGPGGASCVYGITSTEPRSAHQAPAVMLPIRFQQGPPSEGVNGISNEALLAIVADRLESFQSGACACAENAMALHKVLAAMRHLASRTRDRVARGVEGTREI
jgi:hypothetical protein